MTAITTFAEYAQHFMGSTVLTEPALLDLQDGKLPAGLSNDMSTWPAMTFGAHDYAAMSLDGSMITFVRTELTIDKANLHKFTLPIADYVGIVTKQNKL